MITTIYSSSLPASAFLFAALVLGLLASLGEAQQQNYTINQCAEMAALDVDLFNYDRYDEYFDDNSTVVLPQAGVYKGADAIEEYLRFPSASSPYVLSETRLNSTMQFMGFDPIAGECHFLFLVVTQNQMDPLTTALVDSVPAKINVGAMYKSSYRISTNNIARIVIYYTPAFLSFTFGTVLNSDKTRRFVCGVLSSEGCNASASLEGNQVTSMEECQSRLGSLPTAQGSESYFDGNSQGCRVLHAVFASHNPKQHCPHIGFVPQADPTGIVKCQTSQEIRVDTLFTPMEVEAFLDFCVQESQTLGTTDCFRLAVSDDNEYETNTTMKPTTGALTSAAKVAPCGFAFIGTTIVVASLCAWLLVGW